jgi:hypothetical protein
MKKSLLILMWVLVAAVAVMTVIALWNHIEKKKEARPFSQWDFPQSYNIENSTDYRADTICLHLAQLLELDTLNIIIVYIPEHVEDKDIEFSAFIQQLPFKKNQFLLMIKRDGISFSELKNILSHEFIHIQQYTSGDLVAYTNFVIYKGEDVYLKEVPYAERPFEIDAFAKDGKLLKSLNAVLY